MDQVDYTLLCERIIALIGGIAFFGICALLGFADPTSTQIYLGLFLFCLVMLSLSIISMLSFWWVFSIKKQILEKDQVNKLIFRSITVSFVLIFILLLNFTNNLNPLTLLFILLALICYFIWL